jgi:hypothetical protein
MHGRQLDSLLSPANAVLLLSATIMAWEPTSARIGRIGLSMRREEEPDGFLPGWLTYIPSDSVRNKRASEMANKVLDMGEVGAIYALAPDATTVTANHVERW